MTSISALERGVAERSEGDSGMDVSSTRTEAEPAFVSTVAKMVAAPSETAVTSPVLETVAVAELEEFQVVGLVRRSPPPLRTSASS